MGKTNRTNETLSENSPKCGREINELRKYSYVRKRILLARRRIAEEIGENDKCLHLPTISMPCHRRGGKRAADWNSCWNLAKGGKHHIGRRFGRTDLGRLNKTRRGLSFPYTFSWLARSHFSNREASGRWQERWQVEGISALALARISYRCNGGRSNLIRSDKRKKFLQFLDKFTLLKHLLNFLAFRSTPAAISLCWLISCPDCRIFTPPWWPGPVGVKWKAGLGFSMWWKIQPLGRKISS